MAKYIMIEDGCCIVRIRKGANNEIKIPIYDLHIQDFQDVQHFY